MHIILMPDGEGRTVSLRFGRRHVALLAAVLTTAFAVALFAGFLAGQQGMPRAIALHTNQGSRLDQLALRIGELQARLARITDIGDRVAKKAGVPLTEQDPPPGRGGPLITGGTEERMNAEALARMLDDLTRQYDHESDRFTLLDAELLSREALRGNFPMDRPVAETGYVTSPFGVRADPFTGLMARHEGMDFSDNLGAPIRAAESGVVIDVRSTSDYGNVVDIDHGNGLTTRYGHCAKILVKLGDVVKRDQQIAVMGSTGRSTGPHVHFEVRRDGVPQNPLNYLSRQL
jgi:murein DD-endopeptidase MepM/ murein hydrolase activator NlpD